MTKLSLTDEQRRDIVRYRLETALSTLSEVESHKANGFYNTAVNRLYYACYYAATAMLISLKIDVRSHDGVRQSIGQHVVLSGILSPEQGRFYSRLFSKRSAGDYDDFFNHSLSTVEELMPQAYQFVDTLRTKLEAWLNDNN